MMKRTLFVALMVAASMAAATAQNTNTILRNGFGYLDAPYVSVAAEMAESGKELTVNTDEMCDLSFAEYTLASTLATKDENGEPVDDSFYNVVRALRYRNGVTTGNATRITGFGEWADNAVRLGFLTEKFTFIPRNQVSNKGMHSIQEGDIIIFVNSKDDTAGHVGLAMYVDDKLTLLHASAESGKVEVSPVAVRQILKDHKTWNGIRVLHVVK